jgi:hypothetical protein
MRRRYYPRRRFGIGHAFGLLFLFRHPLVAVILIAVVLLVALYRRRR